MRNVHRADGFVQVGLYEVMIGWRSAVRFDRGDRSFHGHYRSVSCRKHYVKKPKNFTSPGSAVQNWYKVADLRHAHKRPIRNCPILNLPSSAWSINMQVFFSVPELCQNQSATMSDFSVSGWLLDALRPALN